jgi:hypothetical protein
MDDARARRIGENEALFREVNERTEELNRGLAGLSDGTMHIYCECGHLDCVQQLVLPLAKYEQIRADPTLFFVLPGHELESVESIVERLDGLNVVRKDPGTPERVARELNPR